MMVISKHAVKDAQPIGAVDSEDILQAVKRDKSDENKHPNRARKSTFRSYHKSPGEHAREEAREITKEKELGVDFTDPQDIF